jgi:hypothetical protein
MNLSYHADVSAIVLFSVLRLKLMIWYKENIEVYTENKVLRMSFNVCFKSVFKAIAKRQTLKIWIESKH